MKVKRRQRTIPMDGLGKVRPLIGKHTDWALPQGILYIPPGAFLVTLQLKEHASQRSNRKKHRIEFETPIRHGIPLLSRIFNKNLATDRCLFQNGCKNALKNVMAFWPLRCWRRLRLDKRCQQTGNSKVRGKESPNVDSQTRWWVEKCWKYVLCIGRPLIA